MTTPEPNDPVFEQAGAPSDNDTMVGILDRLRNDGFAVDLRARGGEGEVVCSGCGATSDAADLTGARQRRLEGASDPADMAIVITARCPTCQRKGILVLGYGPNADVSDVAVLDALPSMADEPSATAR